MIEIDVVLMGIESRQQRNERGAADAGRHIPVDVASGLSSQPIEMGRLNVWIPHESKVGKRLIIRDNQDNVRPFSFGTV